MTRICSWAFYILLALWSCQILFTETRSPIQQQEQQKTLLDLKSQSNATHIWQWDRNHYLPPINQTTTNRESPLWQEALLVSDAPNTLSIYQQQTGMNNLRRERRALLIVQDAGAGMAEREICDITSRVSRAYAKRWYDLSYPLCCNTYINIYYSLDS
jgi:hypothetical protein